VIYCDGVELIYSEAEPTPHLLDEGYIPSPDIYGVLRCTSAGCQSRDNAGKVWPDHISGVVQTMDADWSGIKTPLQAMAWAVRAFPVGSAYREAYLNCIR
jgi:hypothetical protein